MLILRNSTAYPFRTVSGMLVRCFFCMESFDDPAMFRSHVETVHAAIDKGTAVFRNLNVPRVDVGELRCALCSEKHQTLQSIAVHLKKEHSLPINEDYDFSLVPIKLDKSVCKCIVCDAKFPALVTLCRHAATHYTATCMVCDQCGTPFENEHCLRKHLLSRHQIFCKICKLTFFTREELIKHVRSSPDCLPSKCRICKRRFSCFEVLNAHYVTAHKMVAQTVKCGECSEVFWNQKTYYRHFKSRHTDDFKCSYCSKAFGAKRDLEEHLPKHTGVKPHQCAACGKCYTTHKGFKDHLLTHEQGSGRYQCPVADCKRNFPLRERMLGHLKKYHTDIYEKVASESN